MFLDNDPLAAQARARVALWTFHGLLLLALGGLLWSACGLPWAAGTLAFLALEPTVAAHLPVVMTDLPLALTLGIAAVASATSEEPTSELQSLMRPSYAVFCLKNTHRRLRTALTYYPG